VRFFVFIDTNLLPELQSF